MEGTTDLEAPETEPNPYTAVWLDRNRRDAQLEDRLETGYDAQPSPSCLGGEGGSSTIEQRHSPAPHAAPHSIPARHHPSSLSTPGVSKNLPPPEEIVEAIQNYVSSYFQLGFLHKAIFVEGYIANNDSVSPILLLAICSISAAFTPSLVARYGGKQRAVVTFLSMADELVGREMLQPSLERAQACVSSVS